MHKVIITITLVAFPFIYAVSQNNDSNAKNSWEKYIHIEAGFIYPGGTIKENISVRQNISYYYDYQYSNGNIYSETSGLALALSYEYYLPKIKSDISTGLRFTGLMTDISGYTSSSSDFFYLRYSMENSDTKFARVKSLNEVNYLLSIPLEFKFIPFRYKNLSLFVKAGIEYSIIRLKSNVDIVFQENSMDEHKDEILSIITEPTNKNIAALYSSIGFRLGKEGKPNYVFETLLPSFYLTKNNFALVDIDNISGFRLSIQFPVNNKK